MMIPVRLLPVLYLAVAAAAAASPSVSPYAGQAGREIKALSREEVEGLLAGQGMGYAKAAELNRYPGPAHVLELAEALQLSEAQHQATRELHARMQARARELGTQLVAAEAALDALFRSGAVDEARLSAVLERIGQLQAQLRGVHLSAHLAQRALLTDAQTQRYVQLRGYESPVPGARGGAHGAHGHGHRH